MQVRATAQADLHQALAARRAMQRGASSLRLVYLRNAFTIGATKQEGLQLVLALGCSLCSDRCRARQRFNKSGRIQTEVQLALTHSSITAQNGKHELFVYF
jgi:hypothetical protein